MTSGDNHSLELDAASISRDVLDLSGQWVAMLDPNDRGLAEQWWHRWKDGGLDAQLPGTTETNRFGHFSSHTTKHHLSRQFPYEGVAWWWRWVRIPEDWAGKVIELSAERCLWTSQAWLGGHSLGQRDSLTTPHRFRCPDVSGYCLLAIRTDNRVDATNESRPGYQGMTTSYSPRTHGTRVAYGSRSCP